MKTKINKGITITHPGVGEPDAQHGMTTTKAKVDRDIIIFVKGFPPVHPHQVLAQRIRANLQGLHGIPQRRRGDGGAG